MRDELQCERIRPGSLGGKGKKKKKKKEFANHKVNALSLLPFLSLLVRFALFL
jgi:hypothetical protein